MQASANPPQSGVKSEELLEFRETFNFSVFVREHLLPSTGLDDAEQLQARLVGQEKDGGILFSWRERRVVEKSNSIGGDTTEVRVPQTVPGEEEKDDDEEEGGVAGGMVTCVGWHLLHTNRFVTLYRHSTDEYICAATLNHEHTLLAFTLVKEDMIGEALYCSFVAEIQPVSRVWGLNLETPDFRRLQFVNAEQAQRSRHSRQQQQVQSCLLVVNPNNYAAIYTFKLQAIRTGYMVLQEPSKDVFCTDFCWYQWDPVQQWLYLAKFERSGTKMQSLLSGENSVVLHCYGFLQNKPDIVLTVALPLPYGVNHYLRGETYFASPFSLTLPVLEINMQVLYVWKGLWCVCLQHGNGMSCDGTPAADNNAEKTALPKNGKLDYTVFIFNNSHMLHMQVPLPMPLIEPLHINFMVLSGFVVAYIPNFLLHILNVGHMSDPCHHMAFGPQESPMIPDFLATNGSLCDPFLSPAVTPTVQSKRIATVVEHKTSSIFEININTATFLRLFKNATSIEMMEDLLHLTVVGLRHHGMALAMIEHLCQRPMQLGDHRLFSEFLLSFAFANTIVEAQRYVSKMLPLTHSPTFCGKVFKNDERVTFAMLRLNTIRKFTVQLLVQSDQRLVRASPDDLLNHEVGDKPFEMLCFLAVTSQPTRPRINILQEIESQDKHSLLISRPLPPTQPNTPATKKKNRKSETSGDSSTLMRTNILSRLSQFTKSGFNPRVTPLQTGTSQTDYLPFLEVDEEEMACVDEEKEILVGVIHKFIGTGLQQRSKTVVGSNVRHYVGEMEKQSWKLLRLIWDSLGFNKDLDPLSRPLCSSPTTLEEILFERLEAYNLAHQEIGFPVPAGFQTLFTSLGFCCLPDTVFLQYLRNGVFVPTRKFMENLLKDVKEEREEVMYEIVCHANPKLASWALRNWKHPTIRTLRPELSAVATEKKNHV